MVEVQLLGTGTPRADPERCGSGTAIEAGGGWILIDCGRGVSQRVVEAELDMQQLRAVFLTHHHSDHVSDLASLAIMHWTSGATTPLVVVAPAGPCAEFSRRCLEIYPDESFFGQAKAESGPRPRMDVRSFAATSEAVEIFADHSFSITSVLVDHHPIEAAVGYRVVADSNVVVVSGDTAVCDGIEMLAAGADLLVHEALRASLMSESLLAWNASAESVGAMAERAGVTHLVLTHLLPAPRDAAGEAEFVEDARGGGFQGQLSVARDKLKLTVPTNR
ncbi:MAG: ribonuclease Z [Acidimicrobiales bacterium]|jgi:ribonuclease Z